MPRLAFSRGDGLRRWLGFSAPGEGEKFEKLLQMTLSVPLYRSAARREVRRWLDDALRMDFALTVRWLFFLRDPRGGMGERRIFRIALSHIAEVYPRRSLSELLPLIPEYGRYDDWFVLIGTQWEGEVIGLVRLRLQADLAAMREEKPVSRMAKWMPSINASSLRTRSLARRLARALGLTNREYRRSLSLLREYLCVAERVLCQGEWDALHYGTLPAGAVRRYRYAFAARDPHRWSAFRERRRAEMSGARAEAAHPHEIVGAYWLPGAFLDLRDEDEELERRWRDLPESVGEGSGALVIADGASWMDRQLPGGGGTASSVAFALAVYMARFCKPPFADRYVALGAEPALVHLGQGAPLREKLRTVLAYNGGGPLDIGEVYRIILGHAVREKAGADALPGMIIAVSAMPINKRVGEGMLAGLREMRQRYKKDGYALPELVYWNVCGRSGVLPESEFANGVTLMDGFSPKMLRRVISGKVLLRQYLLDVLESERYDAVRRSVCGHSGEGRHGKRKRR